MGSSTSFTVPRTLAPHLNGSKDRRCSAGLQPAGLDPLCSGLVARTLVSIRPQVLFDRLDEAGPDVFALAIVAQLTKLPLIRPDACAGFQSSRRSVVLSVNLKRLVSTRFMNRLA